MSDLLLDVPEMLSPRLRWMKEHGIHIIDNGPDVMMESENKEWREYRYCAHNGPNGQKQFGFDGAAFGDTEDEALTSLAMKLGLKLWNEV